MKAELLAVVCILVAFHALQAADSEPIGVKQLEQRSLLPYFKQMRAKQLHSHPDAKEQPRKDESINLLRLLADVLERYALPSSIAAHQQVYF